MRTEGSVVTPLSATVKQRLTATSGCWKRPRGTFPWRLQRALALSTTWFWTSGLQSNEKVNFYSLKPPALGVLVTAALRWALNGSKRHLARPKVLQGGCILSSSLYFAIHLNNSCSWCKIQKWRWWVKSNSLVHVSFSHPLSLSWGIAVTSFLHIFQEHWRQIGTCATCRTIPCIRLNAFVFLSCHLQESEVSGQDRGETIGVIFMVFSSDPNNIIFASHHWKADPLAWRALIWSFGGKDGPVVRL